MNEDEIQNTLDHLINDPDATEDEKVVFILENVINLSTAMDICPHCIGDFLCHKSQNDPRIETLIDNIRKEDKTKWH